MTVSENLKKAKELIQSENNWCQGSLHRGHAHCSIGALEKIIGTVWCYSQERIYLGKISKRKGYINVAHLNDSTDHKTVMEVFDLAICMAECDKQTSRS